MKKVSGRRQQIAAGSGRPLDRSPLAPKAEKVAGRFYEEIRETIRREIATGVLQPGDKIPSERDLAEKFDVSRTVAREARRSLEIEGVVGVRKGSRGGAFILESGAGPVTRSLRDMIDFGRTSLSTLLETRMMIMDLVVSVACDRAGPDDIAALRRNVDELEQVTLAGQYEKRTYKASEFNRLLAKATNNEILVTIVEAMSSVLLTFLLIAGPRPMARVIETRREIIDLIENNDRPAARRAMRAFLLDVNAHLRKHELTSLRAIPRARKKMEPGKGLNRSVLKKAITFQDPGEGSSRAVLDVETLLEENRRLKIMLAEALLDAPIKTAL